MEKFVGKTLKNKKLVGFVGKPEIFQGYKYRQRRITTNPKTGKTLVHSPYIPLKESSNHSYALTYDKWSEIIDAYFNTITDVLMEGHDIMLPKKLGLIRLVRKKKAPIKKNGNIFRNLATFGYVPRIVWHRKREGRFMHKHWFTFNLSRNKIWNKISKRLVASPELIFKFPEYSDL